MTIKANFKWKYYLIPLFGLFHLIGVDIKITSWFIHNFKSMIDNENDYKLTLETNMDKIENNFWIYLFVSLYMIVHVTALMFIVSVIIPI
jgi:hypothetical protein